MNKIAVLGADMVGSVIARDLAENYSVTAFDFDEDKLRLLNENFNINIAQCDISDSHLLKEKIKDYDLIIEAVPGYMGFNTLKAIIEAGKNAVDISFFGEDPFELNALAEKNNVTAIVDCGVAPGLSNIILGMHNKVMDVESFECFVGGLPVKRVLPFQYKVPFSPTDVIEEYTRPARIIENSKQVIKPALSEIELINIDPVGTLEAFNSDGLRTLLRTMKIPNMKEKTLRYPGHAASVRLLKDAGFFDNNKIEIDGKKLKPVDFASKILFSQWKLEPGEREFTAMIIKIKGTEKGKHLEYTYNLFDEYDSQNNITSMSRTTGYTCSSAARCILNKSYKRKGISPPEYLGADENCFNEIIKDLNKRGVILSKIIN